MKEEWLDHPSTECQESEICPETRHILTNTMLALERKRHGWGGGGADIGGGGGGRQCRCIGVSKWTTRRLGVRTQGENVLIQKMCSQY